MKPLSPDGNDIQILGPVDETAVRAGKGRQGGYDGIVRRDERPVRLPVEIADVMDPFQVAGVLQGGDAERLLVDDMHVPFGRAGVFVFGEGIRVIVPQRLQHLGLAIDLHGLLVDIVERPHVVQAARMVLVLVRQQDGVQVADPFRKHLHPEVRACVDEHLEPLVLHERRRPEPLVMRILRPAHRALAPDDRNPLRGPCSQECELYVTHY